MYELFMPIKNTLKTSVSPSSCAMGLLCVTRGVCIPGGGVHQSLHPRSVASQSPPLVLGMETPPCPPHPHRHHTACSQLFGDDDGWWSMVHRAINLGWVLLGVRVPAGPPHGRLSPMGCAHLLCCLLAAPLPSICPTSRWSVAVGALWEGMQGKAAVGLCCFLLPSPFPPRCHPGA